MQAITQLSRSYGLRQFSRRCGSLVLRRSVAPQCLPFELSKNEALKHFADWANVHDSAKDVSSFVSGAEVTMEAHAVPYWCFDVHDRNAWPTDQRRWMYAGVAHDAVSLGAALSETLVDASGAQALDLDNAASGLKSREPLSLEESELSARSAWQMSVLEEGGEVAGDDDLRAVALLFVPAYRVQYTYLGMPLTAWTCGRTGLTDGINTRGLGAQFFEDWLPEQHEFWRRADPWLRSFDQHAARAMNEDPKLAAAVASSASKIAGVGAASMFRFGARLASRHPKVVLATLIAPYVISWARPVLEAGWRSAQAQMRARRSQHEADAAELDARADWEDLLRRGEERMRSPGSEGAQRTKGKQEADKRRRVDFESPRSVLGLPPDGRVSPRTLEAAFRRELLAWHPDRNPSTPAEAAERTRAILAAYRAMRR